MTKTRVFCFVSYTTHDTGFNQRLMWEGFVHFSVHKDTWWLFSVSSKSHLSGSVVFTQCEVCVWKGVGGGMLWLTTPSESALFRLGNCTQLNWQKGTVFYWLVAYSLLSFQFGHVRDVLSPEVLFGSLNTLLFWWHFIYKLCIYLWNHTNRDMNNFSLASKT